MKVGEQVTVVHTDIQGSPGWPTWYPRTFEGTVLKLMAGPPDWLVVTPSREFAGCFGPSWYYHVNWVYCHVNWVQPQRGPW